MNAALALQCYKAGKGVGLLQKLFTCVSGGQISSYEVIDGAMQFEWSTSPPVKDTPLAIERYRILKALNSVVNKQLKAFSDGDVSPYGCGTLPLEKLEKVRGDVVEFQKALNKYLPITKAQAQAQGAVISDHE